ncbi:MAG: putative sugar O-methyltransferase [Chloroflexi bacterium]|nr:putative sugar O-methyltransferase [Chloroflexota bacterium]
MARDHDELISKAASLSKPALFWKRLGREHEVQLARHGFDAVKRQQALRYFTWRWSWRSLRGSRQMRFLLAHSSPSTLLRCLAEPARHSSHEWEGVPWSRRDRWLYVTAARLLWEYARKHDPLSVLSLPEPKLGDPLPVRWRGRLISQDLANAALETAAITRALDNVPPLSILEVGAGYGRTAYALLESFPEATYTVVDIEPALTISRWYLTRLFPSERIRFLNPGEAESLGARSADLVISISSLQEMTPGQVVRYLDLFDRVGEGGVVYLKQWRSWMNPEDGIAFDFRQMPIPPRWRLLFDEPAPVQANFQQAAWRVGW